jgi:hypothetical protein
MPDHEHHNNSLSSLKETFSLYKRITEQYKNPEILRIIRSLVPDNIVSQTIDDDGNFVPLLKWFKILECIIIVKKEINCFFIWFIMILGAHPLKPT